MKGEVITGLIWIGLSALVAFESIKLELGQWSEPGPGFLPFLSSIFLGLFALIFLGRKVSKRVKKDPLPSKPFRLGPQWVKVAYLTGASFIYIFFLWDSIGYLIGTTVFLIFILKIVGLQPWKKSLLLSVVAVVVSYLIFQTWLQCLLPKGVLKGFNF